MEGARLIEFGVTYIQRAHIPRAVPPNASEHAIRRDFIENVATSLLLHLLLNNSPTRGEINATLSKI